MNRKIFSLLVPMMLLCRLAAAQVWSLPAAEQNVEVKCTTCLAPNTGLRSVGYSGAVKAFVGRFADSTTTRDYQQTFRTARAGLIRFAPERNRVYMALGSAVVAYNLDTFFNRVSAHEPLVPSTTAPVSPSNFRSGPPEVYLRWNKFFYPENTSSGWVTPLTDGQDRLYSFDWDDRGYVYIGTSSYFGWGIVADDGGSDGGLMPSMHQEYPPDEFAPSSVISLKSAGHYYLIIPGVTASAVWDVTVPATPVRRADLNVLFGPVVKMPGNRLAFIGVHGVVVYSVDTLLAGGGPDFTDGSHSYLDLATDGTNLFAVSYSAGTAYLTSFVPDQSGRFIATQYTLAQSFQPSNVNFGGGYLAVGGSYGDTKLFKLDAKLAPTEAPTNGYFGSYYSNPPIGYAKPDFTNTGPVYPYQQGSNLYLVVPAHGLGDIYQLDMVVSDPIPCSPLNSSTVAINFSQAGDPACGPGGGACIPAKDIAFDVTAIGGAYNFACGTGHTFSWLFGDGQTYNTKSFTRTFPPIDFPVQVTINNGETSVTLHSSVHVPSLCDFNTNSVAISASQDLTDCSASGGICAIGHSVAFDAIAVAPFDFSCGTYTFAWTFSDGQHFSTKSFSRLLNTGETTVDLTVTSGLGQSITRHATILSAVFDPACTPVNANVVALTFSQSGTTCGPAGGDCTAARDIAFDVNAIAPYSLSCMKHTFAWSFGDGQTVSTKSFSRQFSAAGDYPVAVTVTDLFSTVTLHSTVHVVQPPACADLNVNSVALNFFQTGTGCGANGGDCASGQSVTFDVNAFPPYSFSCASHTFTWVFGDGQHFNTKSFSRVFNVGGDVPVDLTVNNGTASVTVHATVHVVGTNGCIDVNVNSATIAFSQEGTSCGPGGGACAAGQNISFDANAVAPATFSCSSHSFTWSFSDGQTFSTKAFARQFTPAGDYPVTLTIGGGSGSFTLHSSVHVGGNSCGTLSDSTVFVTYQGSSSQCSELGGSCSPGEAIDFRINDFHPAYNFACAPHTFTWDFGDGTGAHQAGQTTSHAYAGGGSFTVKVTINNGSATFDAKTVVAISNPATPIEAFDFTVVPWYVNGVRVPNGYLFIPFSEPSPSDITWNWDFGDGNKAVTHDYKAVSHTFADSDDHTVTLTTPQGTGAHSHNLRTRRRPGR